MEWSKIRSIYCCGLTPQRESHLGHVRTLYLAILLKETLSIVNGEVKLCVNWTDMNVELYMDSLRCRNDFYNYVTVRIARTRRELSSFMNLKSIDFQPRVSQYIGEIRRDIIKIRDKITIDRGGINLKTFEHRLLRNTTSGGFALWKYQWLRGRGMLSVPGWHIECSTMIDRIFPGGVDLHLGGKDLCFPHHVNEDLLHRLIHRRAVTRNWIHFGLVLNSGAKMSKSLGNVKWTRHLPSRLKVLLYLTFFTYDKDINFKEEAIDQNNMHFNSIMKGLNILDLEEVDIESDRGDLRLFLDLRLSWYGFYLRVKNEGEGLKRLLSLLINLNLLGGLNRARFRVVRRAILMMEALGSRNYGISDRIRSFLLKNHIFITPKGEDGKNRYFIRIS